MQGSTEPLDVVASFQDINGEVWDIDPARWVSLADHLRHIQEFAMRKHKAVLWIRDANQVITHAILMDQKAWDKLI